jgi:pimeloyl-ACP methyl ester carboxylesterase
MTDFVFLHGGGQGSWVWNEAIAAMQAQSGSAHRYLALDGPGCGAKRGQDTSGYDFAGITAELVADIESSGMCDVVLVGHSQAGLSMPAMAQLRPDLFARLICVSCAAPEPGLNAVEMAMHSACTAKSTRSMTRISARANAAARCSATICLMHRPRNFSTSWASINGPRFAIRTTIGLTIISPRCQSVTCCVLRT